MKLPRWLLVSLIAVSAVALLAVPAWLWVAIPRRTAEKFIAAVEADDLEMANRLLTNGVMTSSEEQSDVPLTLLHIRPDIGGSLGFEKKTKGLLTHRDAYDLLCGRQFMSSVEEDGFVVSWMPFASCRKVTVTHPALLKK